MGFFDLGLSDILSPIASFLGTQSTNEQAAANQASANAFSAQQFATRYQTTVKDLEAAGLNPMMAYGANPSAPTSTTPAPVQNALGSAVSSYQTSKATSAQTALQKEQASAAQSQVELNTANATKAKADALVSLKDAELRDQQILNEKSRNPNIEALTQAYQGQATASAASAAQSRKQIEVLTQNIDNLKAELKRIQQSGDISAPEADIAKKYPTYHYIFHTLMPSLSGSVPNVNIFNRRQ